MTSRNWGVVDALRGVAILSVVLVHSSNRLATVLEQQGIPVETVSREVFQFGRHGVQLFFLISGFLLAELYKDFPNSKFMRIFWMRRVARIWPLWGIFSTLIFSAWYFEFPRAYGETYASIDTAFSSQGGLMPLQALLLTLVFLGFLNPLVWNSTVPGGWSIQLEVFNYLLFGFFRTKSVDFWLWLTAVIGGLQLFSQFFAQIMPLFSPIVRLNPFGGLVFFVAGVLVSRFINDKSVFKKANSVWLSGPIIGLLFLTLKPPFGSNPNALAFIAVALVLVFQIGEKGIVSRTLRAFGRYSYFIYFFHFFVLLQVRDIALVPIVNSILESSTWVPVDAAVTLLTWLVTLAVSYPTAWVSWRLIERPIINKSRRW